MSIQVQISEKSSNPQTLTEPKNMTTIDLNKNDNLSDDIKNSLKNNIVKKFHMYSSIKSLVVAIGIFILLGLCVTILILIIHKGYSKNNASISNSTSSKKELNFKVLFDNKDQISACKISKSYEDCCFIFLKEKNSKEKCDVEKMLKLFLRYEIEANRRIKRQYYDNENFAYEDQIYPPDYSQNSESNFYDTDYFDVPLNDYYDQNYVDPIYNSDTPYFYDNNHQEESNYYHDYQSRLRDASHQTSKLSEITERNSFQKFPTVVDNRQLLNQDPSNNRQTDTKSSQSTTSLPLLKKCSDDKCPSYIKASTTIGNITNLNAASGKIKITFNETKIKLTPQVRQNERISQGDSFDVKPSVEDQPLSQSKQANPCFYPMSDGFFSPYGANSNFYPNPVLMPLNPTFRGQPLYVINPQFYPSLPMQPQNNYQNIHLSKNAVQVTNAGGQNYLCYPFSSTNNNIAGLQGVEIRRNSEYTLQELVENMSKNSGITENNKTREALTCPFGTQSCNDGSKCIQSNKFCDNEVNCNDASDEMNCSCKERVGEIRWCDGYLDCPNGEDEANCFDCGFNEISCDDWSRFHRGTCVPISQKCDGIKQCEITGKDEEDCSILTDHLGQHSFYKVSNAAGFLHRNYRGKWYPTCFGSEAFSLEVCKTEAGPTNTIPTTNLVITNDNYPGPFLDLSPADGITLANSCMKNKASFVECPPMFCGLRLTITNPFRNAEVDTSAEQFLLRRKSHAEEIVGGPRVVGGKPSQPTSWPWVVSIYKNGVFHCGGVLISDIWILTAAHCVDRFWLYYYEVQAGVLRRFSYSPMEQTRWATVAIPHEAYSKKSLKNDIALMKLSKPLRFNRYVRPICLPSEATAGEDFLKGPRPNTVCTTVGWGATIEHGADPDHLREVEIPILPNCKHTEDKEGDEICAGLLEGGKDACQGDSGGPLMCQNIKNRSQWYLAGIVSHGEGCARPNEPGVYTKVSKYIGWINENINGKVVGRLPLQKCPGYVCQGTKKCLPKKRHCDRIVDCLFGDDEINCWQSHEPSSPVVGSGRTLFNRLIDFLDFSSSSEENVIDNNENKNNRTVEFDNSEDSKSEEVIKNETAYDNVFNCKNMLQTIPFEEKCDKIVNCEDGTDELGCLCVDYLYKFHQEAICDGITDCKDMSDEINCVKCSKTESLCRITQKCIPSEKRCDGRADCINSEDEWDCVALTDGRTLVFDSDLRPKQSMKGIITINRFGVWRPLCTNASVDNAASIAANVCNLLGFEEYTVFHKLSVVDKPLTVTIDGFYRNHSSSNEMSFCTGLFVRCLNKYFDRNVYRFPLNNFTSKVDSYITPWNALIYINGIYKCTGTIIDSHWILTVKSCFTKKELTDGYVTALLGKGKAYLDVEGPHEQIVLINGINSVNENGIIVLYSDQKIEFTRYIKAAQIATMASFAKEHCVAVGMQDKKTKVVVLETKTNCSQTFDCFKIVNSKCEDEDLDLWNGVITCFSKDGWYISSVYNNIERVCDFEKQKFHKINENEVKTAMGNDLSKLNSSECAGFRCLLGECLVSSKVCDGVTDCRNGEDEELHLCLKHIYCPPVEDCVKLPICKWSEFKCKNGTCVPKSSFCDTVLDCQDNYDEPEECSCKTYLQTVHPEKICDGTVNCWDRSDENPLICKCKYPTNITCVGTDFCVSQEMVCDGFKDCPGGEDESNCYGLVTKLQSIHGGEVVKRTAGIWHSGCFSQNHTTTELEEICRSMGYEGGSAKQLIPPKNIDVVASRPIMDHYDTVWIRQNKSSKFQLKLRTGNAPYVKFIEDPNCYKLFIECL